MKHQGGRRVNGPSKVSEVHFCSQQLRIQTEYQCGHSTTVPMWQQLRIQQPEYQAWPPHSNLTLSRGGSLGLAGVAAANKNIFSPISALISHQSRDLPFVNDITIMYICKMEQRKLVLMIKEHIYSVHLEIHMNIWEIDITHCKTLLICFK